METQRRPTLHEFISTCKRRHRCKVHSILLLGPRGESDCRCLIRTTGLLRGAAMPGIHGDEPLTRDVLESLCNRLEVSVDRFAELAAAK